MKYDYILQGKISGISKEIRKEIEFYLYLEALKEELSKLGFYQRLEQIPQLGLIRVSAAYLKKRQTYMMMQLFLHDVCRRNKTLKSRFSYGTYISAKDLGITKKIIMDGKQPSIADAEQILVLSSNIGHFYNTFASSRAMITFLRHNSSALSKFLNLFDAEDMKQAAKEIIDNEDYHRFHLLNGYLIMSNCSSSNPSVMLSKALLMLYLNRSNLELSEKMTFVFQQYEIIRDLAMITYDLQVASIPFQMAVWKEKALNSFLVERVSAFQNNEAASAFMRSTKKLLNDTLYCKEEQVLKEYQAGKMMAGRMTENSLDTTYAYLQTYILGVGYGINEPYHPSRTYGAKNKPWLKVTLKATPELARTLDRIEYVDAGYYDRNESRTFIAQIKDTCPNRGYTALKLLRSLILSIQEDENELRKDKALLHGTLFFLSEVFQKTIQIDATVTSQQSCVIGVRGSRKRWGLLNKALLESKTHNEDSKHELEFMRDYLKRDHKNDYTIMIPASIKVKTPVFKDLCEIDGIIVFPYRTADQIVILEAKNRAIAGRAAHCIKEKLEKLSIPYDEERFILINKDAAYPLSIEA